MPSPLITVLDGTNQPLGPFPVEEIQRRLQAGELRDDQLAFTEGLSQWTPLASVLAHVRGSQVPPPYAPGATVVAQPPAFAQAPGSYAGFWLRFIAYFLDGILIWVVLYAVIAILMLSTNPTGFIHDQKTGGSEAMDAAPFWVKIIFVVSFIFGPLLYFALMESGPRQGTLGKMALGLKVTDLEGRRLTFWHAFGRTAAKFISNATCIVFYIGFIMAGFTERKQALHDIIASTLVWKK